MTRKRKKNRKVVLKTLEECAPVVNTILLYGTPDLQHVIYETSLTSPDPFVLSFGNIAYTDTSKFKNISVYNSKSWGYVDGALDVIAEKSDDISTVIVNNLTMAYDTVLRKIIFEKGLLYPNSKDIWLEAVYRVKSLVLHLMKLKKNVILLVGSKEIFIEDEVNNALYIRPAISDGLFTSFSHIADATLFMYQEQEGKTKKLKISGESPVNNWYLASCKSHALRNKLSTDFSTFLTTF